MLNITGDVFKRKLKLEQLRTMDVEKTVIAKKRTAAGHPPSHPPSPSVPPPYPATCPLPSQFHAIHPTNSSPFHAIQPIPRYPLTLSIAP